MRRLAQFGVTLLGVEAWVALRDTDSVLSLTVGCACVAVLACCFAFRVRREIRAIRDDSRQARADREARRHERH
ncbi:hypothetical protein ACSYGO_21575 [Streptomyces krungchingensis]